MIEKYENEFTLEVTPAYAANINIEFSQGEEIEISPYTETTIPINITNYGNARTRVFAVIDDASDSWTVSISNLMIDIGSTEQTFLNVTADHKFTEETIKLIFTPTYSEDATNAGEPFVTSIVFINDGSYKEEGDFDIDTNLLFGIIFVIILHLIFALILKKRRK